MKSMDRKTRTQLCDLLYERISPETIAAECSKDRMQARAQVKAHLQQILIGGSVPQIPMNRYAEAIEDMINSLLGFGPIDDLLSDEEITEVMVNGPKKIFYERDGHLFPSDRTFGDEEALRGVIDRIISPLGRRIDEQTPIVNARLKEGHRVHAIIPPVVLDGPTLTVRKFRAKIYTLSELAGLGSFPDWISVLLRWMVLLRLNIAVTGGTGSGKTTLLNALSLEIGHGERIITIEDSAELKFHAHPHVVRLEARAQNIEGYGEITIRDLVITSLRMRPDRIVVGEVRGGEALEMLQAMNTGHDGSLTTVHANSPFELISRLTTMVSYNSSMGTDQITAQIASALDIVIHQSRLSDGSRRVTSICEVVPDKEAGCRLVEIVRFEQTGLSENGEVVGRNTLCHRPLFLDDLAIKGIATRREVLTWQAQTR
ncbi:MAG: CpaF family protein [Actinomycetia bacterium]|nr:CpaF family protein [Actinomycetes bacterium]